VNLIVLWLMGKVLFLCFGEVFMFFLRLVVLFFCLGSVSAFAKHRGGDGLLDARDVVPLVNEQVPGKVLGVRLNGRDAEPVYRVKVLRDEGRVKTLWVDPHSGKVLRQTRSRKSRRAHHRRR